MTWREAKSLLTLEGEIQKYYPGTTTWEIGDQDHRGSYSDHNPNSAGVVCAKDILGDAGLNLQGLADHLVSNPPPNLRYVIFNRRIAERKNGFEWRTYSGKSPHDHHLHVSVGNGPDGRGTRDYDDTASWNIAKLAGKPSAPHKPSKPSKPSTDKKLGDKMPTIQRGNKGSRVRMLQGLLLAWGHDLTVDGVFGPNTDRAVRAFQSKYAKPVDGIVGRVTWNKLLGL